MEWFYLLKAECQVSKIADELKVISESGLCQQINLGYLDKKLDEIKNRLLSEVDPQRLPLPHLE